MLRGLSDSEHLEASTLPIDWIENGTLNERNSISDTELTREATWILADAGIPQTCKAPISSCAAAGSQDLRNIIYADQRDGESSFREVLLGDVVASGGGRWDYS